jgi:hypothetical protein
MTGKRSINTVVHEIAIMHETADRKTTSDNDRVALISSSDLGKITHRYDQKRKNKVNKMKIHIRL